MDMQKLATIPEPTMEERINDTKLIKQLQLDNISLGDEYKSKLDIISQREYLEKIPNVYYNKDTHKYREKYYKWELTVQHLINKNDQREFNKFITPYNEYYTECCEYMEASGNIIKVNKNIIKKEEDIPLGIGCALLILFSIPFGILGIIMITGYLLGW